MRFLIRQILRDGAHGLEDRADLFLRALHLQSVLPADRDAELQAVDGVKSETGYEQGFVAVDVVGGEILEVKGADDELFQLVFEVSHDLTSHQKLTSHSSPLANTRRDCVRCARVIGSPESVPGRSPRRLRGESWGVTGGFCRTARP